jgi:hypothetical protein
MEYGVHLAWAGFELTTLVVIGTNCIVGSYISNYHTITTTTSPLYIDDQVYLTAKYMHMLYTVVNRLCVTMFSVLVSGAVGHVLDPRLGQAKDY